MSMPFTICAFFIRGFSILVSPSVGSSVHTWLEIQNIQSSLLLPAPHSFIHAGSVDSWVLIVTLHYSQHDLVHSFHYCSSVQFWFRYLDSEPQTTVRRHRVVSHPLLSHPHLAHPQGHQGGSVLHMLSRITLKDRCEQGAVEQVW